MTSDRLFLEENVNSELYLWVNLNNADVILVDDGISGAVEHYHHTDYVKAKPSVFGLDIEDVIDAQNVRDEKLLVLALKNKFVRAVIDFGINGVNLEGISLRDLYKSLRILMKKYNFDLQQLYLDIRNPENPDAMPVSHVLSGKRLELFFKNGVISNSRMLEDPYQEEDDSSFTHDGDDYDLNGILIAVDDTDVEEFKTSSLDWILKHDKLDFDRLVNADPNEPILVTKWDDKLVVIDGLHRLAATIMQGNSTIAGKMVPATLLSRFKLSA